MTQAKHTPGPWSVSTKQGSVGAIAHASGFIAFTGIPRSIDEIRLEGESWLSMRERTEPAHKDLQSEITANARLIASAPELLEALLEIDARLRRCFVTGASAAEAYDSFYQEVVSSAIAKATGATA